MAPLGWAKNEATSSRQLGRPQPTCVRSDAAPARPFHVAPAPLSTSLTLSHLLDHHAVPCRDTTAAAACAQGEVCLFKPGKGAFYATDLHMILQGCGVTHLIFAGVTTEVGEGGSWHAGRQACTPWFGCRLPGPGRVEWQGCGPFPGGTVGVDCMTRCLMQPASTFSSCLTCRAAPPPPPLRGPSQCAMPPPLPVHE